MTDQASSGGPTYPTAKLALISISDAVSCGSAKPEIAAKKRSKPSCTTVTSSRAGVGLMTRKLCPTPAWQSGGVTGADLEELTPAMDQQAALHDPEDLVLAVMQMERRTVARRRHCLPDTIDAADRVAGDGDAQEVATEVADHRTFAG